MSSQNDITDEALAEKEREIASLFGIAISEPGDIAASESRVNRIMRRAREEPSPGSHARIERIMERLADAGDGGHRK